MNYDVLLISSPLPKFKVFFVGGGVFLCWLWCFLHFWHQPHPLPLERQSGLSRWRYVTPPSSTTSEDPLALPSPRLIRIPFFVQAVFALVYRTKGLFDGGGGTESTGGGGNYTRDDVMQVACDALGQEQRPEVRVSFTMARWA